MIALSRCHGERDGRGDYSRERREEFELWASDTRKTRPTRLFAKAMSAIGAAIGADKCRFQPLLMHTRTRI